MTELLLRLFVKNYQDTESTAVRGSVGKLAGTMGIVCNAVLFVLKLAVGLLSGAVSIVADALNNLSDTASSVVTLLGFRLAQRPADKDHPYGHARYEYLSGLTVAVLIIIIGVELAESSVRKILTPAPVTFSPVTVMVLAASIAVKLWMSLFCAKTGKLINSTALQATSTDNRNDVITTAAVLAGCCVEWIWKINIDGYLGAGVAAFILYSGISLVRATISPLLGERADQQLTDRISKYILSYDRVLGIHDLLVHDYGPGQCFASVHVELSAQEDPLVCHDIIDAIECDILEQMNVHLVIHHDPVVTDDAEWSEMRQTVNQIVAQIDARLSIHDFRIVRGASQTKLVFDLAVPYCMHQQCVELKEAIDGALEERNKNYATVIRFDEN